MTDFHFSNDFTRNIDAMVYTCGYEDCKPGHSYGPAIRSGYIVHYILKGKGFFQCRNKIYRLHSGDAFCIHPNERIYYEADSHEPWSYSWIGMRGIKIQQYLKRTSFYDAPYLHLNEDPELLRCHEKMLEASMLSENRDLMMNSVLYEYLYLLTQKFPRENLSPQEKQNHYVQETLQYLENHYEENFSLQDISAQLNIERSYLYRLFKSSVGVSMKDYLLDLRISRECSLLSNSSLSISDISRSVGYEDPLYFSKLFKKKKDCSPSQYRRNFIS